MLELMAVGVGVGGDVGAVVITVAGLYTVYSLFIVVACFYF